MNLLEATSHVLEAARETPGADRTPLKQAIARVDKRIQLLRRRAVKARRRVRRRAWWHTLKSYGGGIAHKPLRMVFACPTCRRLLDFGDFARGAHYTGHAHLEVFKCPGCGHDLTQGMQYDLILPGEL